MNVELFLHAFVQLYGDEKTGMYTILHLYDGEKQVC